MKAATVNDTQFRQEVLESDQVVLIDFWAPWCGPCRAMSPVVDQLAGDLAGVAKVVKVNVDESPVTAQQFGIRAIPSFFVMKQGQVVESLAGTQSAGRLTNAVQHAISA
ncbi:MAG: thioredoxin [Pirellulaceae bacterium]